MEPIILKPACKDYLWGGKRLREEFGKESEADRIAETWELSCHPNGESIVASGEFEGMSLTQWIENAGKEVLGRECEKFDRFPIIIKLIDANQKLSVQVHPSDSYALKTSGEYGKTEMWYVLDCEPDASIIYGFNREIEKEEFAQRIANGTLAEVLNFVPVHKGDVFFIESGTIHAIGEGILIAEIQQNSDATYRVYDYGRVGADGKTRELHIDKAIDVTNLTVAKKGDSDVRWDEYDGYKCRALASCKYFATELLKIETKATLSVDSKSFVSLLCVDGEAVLACNGKEYKMIAGTSVFLPASLGEYSLIGKADVILSHI